MYIVKEMYKKVFMFKIKGIVMVNGHIKKK